MATQQGGIKDPKNKIKKLKKKFAAADLSSLVWNSLGSRCEFYKQCTIQVQAKALGNYLLTVEKTRFSST